MTEIVKPGTTRQDRRERLQQRSTKVPQGHRKGSRAARKNRAIEESRRG